MMEEKDKFDQRRGITKNAGEFGFKSVGKRKEVDPRMGEEGMWVGVIKRMQDREKGDYVGAKSRQNDRRKDRGEGIVIKTNGGRVPRNRATIKDITQGGLRLYLSYKD